MCIVKFFRQLPWGCAWPAGHGRSLLLIGGIALSLGLKAQPATIPNQPAAEDEAPLPTIPLSQEEAPRADVSGERAGRVLETITVTAQKLEQSLEEVPASVSTIDGQVLRESGIVELDELAGYTANTQITIKPAGGQIRVRGFGTSSTNAGFEPSVATVIDGVYYGRSNFLSAFFYDLDRIEILRGPQGTLFGKNATAGVVNVVTQGADFYSGGQVDLLLGDFGQQAMRPAMNIPFSDTLALRLAANFMRNDGLLQNTFLERPEYNVDEESLKARLLWQPGGAWQLDLGAFYSEQSFNNGLYQPSVFTASMQELAQSYDPEADAVVDFRTSLNVPTLIRTRTQGVQANWDYDFEPWGAMQYASLSSVTSWAEYSLLNRDLDADFTAAPVIRNRLLEPSPYRQFSQELRFVGEADSMFGWGQGFNFVVGLFYFDSSLDARELFELEDLGAAGSYITAAEIGNAPLPPGLISGVLRPTFDTLAQVISSLAGVSESADVLLRQDGQAYAAFGQVEYFLDEHWGVIAGLRVGEETKDGLMSSEANGNFITLISDVEPHESVRRREESEFSPKVGLTYKASDTLSAYATWSRGFKSGGFNGLPLNDRNLEYEPERADSTELGVKTRLLGGAMRLTAALFHTDFSDLQVNTFGEGTFIILNAAEARSQGFEMDLTILPPLPGMQILATVGFADTRYTSYPDAPAQADAPAGVLNNPLVNALPVPLCEFVDGSALDEQGPVPLCTTPSQDLSGRVVARAPRWTASVVPSFSAYYAPWGLFANFAFDVLYQGSQFLDGDLDPRTRQDAITQYNARLVVGRSDESWSLVLSARNLSGEIIWDEALDQPLAPGNFSVIRGDRGRFFSAQLAWNF